MIPPSLSSHTSLSIPSSSTATYTRLVDLYSSPLRRSSTTILPDSPPPAYTLPNRIRARTIDSPYTELRRSKRQRNVPPLNSTSESNNTPVIKSTTNTSTSIRSNSRVKRLPAHSTSLRSANNHNHPFHNKLKSYHTSFNPNVPSHDTTNMSFLNPNTNYLSARIEVIYENGGLVEMVGGPNTGSSYSLSGHILLSLPILPRGSSSRMREVKELTVTMESMTDYHDDHGRYTPFRLHTYTSNLAENPLTIPELDHLRPSDSRIVLTIPFDLRLPGWLPPTHISQLTKVEHGVTAKALIAWTPNVDSEGCGDSIAIDEPIISKPLTRRANFNNYFFPNASLSPRTTCTSSSRHTSFTVLRHRLPASITPADRPNERQYTLKPEADPDSPVECVVLCPDWVDVNGPERSLKIALRLRAKRSDLEVSVVGSTPTSSQSSLISGFPPSSQESAGSIPMLRSGKGGLGLKAEDPYTHVLELGMEVEEVERFSSTPITSWGQSFPVPRDQPNRTGTLNPLLSARSTYADIGIVMQNDNRPHRAATSRSCLLADDGTQRNFFFADDGLALADKWRKVNVVLPMPAMDSKSGPGNRPQSELDSPFLRVRHNLKIKMVCRNSGTDETKIIVLTTPIRFGTLPSTHPESKLKADTHLPAYIQLFHENGDLRECDPLPLYSKDGPEEDIIMEEPTSTPPSLLPAIKPVSAGVPPLPPLAIRRATSPARQIEIPPMEEDDPMEGDSSDSEDSSSDSGSSGSSGSSSGSSTSRMSIDGINEEEEQIQNQVLVREAEHRVERERERQREIDMDRQRRMELQRERQRETRSQAPPPTPRTPGGRKLARNPRSVRTIGGG